LFGEDRVCWDISKESSDPGFDFIYRGALIDVKCTRYDKFPEMKLEPTSLDKIYCLVSVDIETGAMGIEGYISSKKVPEASKGRDLKKSASKYLVPKSALKKTIQEVLENAIV